MKILWFSVTPSLFTSIDNGHNGGGWIASLEELVRTVNDVELGISFECPSDDFKVQNSGVTYYPLDTRISFLKRVVRFFKPLKHEETFLIPKCLKVIEDFKPDVIHIFGSENYFGLLSRLSPPKPEIIHMQGCLLSYYNAFYPISVNFKDILLSKNYSFLQKIMEYRNTRIFKQKALREIKILKSTRNFFGRTHWDRSIIRVYNPSARYFYCSEVLRDVFYKENVWRYPNTKKVMFVSTISKPLYKGMDVILKTAYVLKYECKLDFVWKVMGVADCKFMESHYGINATDVNIDLFGCVSQDVVLEQLMNAHFYVHPSYIDNSPNSICEAQMVGTPVIACNVGGVSSLVNDGKTGYLVPANDPVKLADVIISKSNDSWSLVQISRNEIETARNRHSKDQILKDLLSAYRELSGNR